MIRKRDKDTDSTSPLGMREVRDGTVDNENLPHRSSMCKWPSMEPGCIRDQQGGTQAAS